VELTAQTTVPVPPRGFHPARVDDKGRLKLPSVFQGYLDELGEKTVFITTLDECTAKIYPSFTWKANQETFANPGEHEAEWLETIEFVANHYGADSERDAQGRVLVPQELRKALGLQDQAVWLGWEKNSISVYREDVYQQKLAASKSKLQTALLESKKRSLLK
jgi:MraZ protein